MFVGISICQTTSAKDSRFINETAVTNEVQITHSNVLSRFMEAKKNSKIIYLWILARGGPIRRE